MALDLVRFYQACNPTRPLQIADALDQRYFINFSEVRGGDVVQELGRTITMLAGDRPTTQSFTGHVGSGKSTELLRLKSKLEAEAFHVIYFQSDQDLEMGNVEVTNVLLAIARRVSASLEQENIRLRPNYFQNLMKEVAGILRSPVSIADVSFSAGIASITAEVKESDELRSQLQQFLEPRTRSIIEAVNEELLKPGIEALQSQGKRGLAVIVDNLDRMDNTPKYDKRLQSEYLFINRGEQLRRLACHVVYTIPMELAFSDDLTQLIMRFGDRPKVLPMVPVRTHDGTPYEPGLTLLRQMVMARAFPDVPPKDRMSRVTEVFDTAESLERLCTISGGHMRNVIRLLFSCLQKEDPPFKRATLESVIRNERDDLTGPLDDDEWQLLLHAAEKGVQGDEDYNTLIRKLYLFEYRAPEARWFGINPVLTETQKYRQLMEAKAQQ
ncbi:MAG: ATP-binding protein [Cyanobacteria bacterium J06642_9]